MLIASLDGTWKVFPDKASKVNIDEVCDPNYNDAGWYDIRVPSHWQESVDALREYSGVVWYRKKFDLENPQGKVWLLFKGVFYRTKVWLNGEYIGEHSGYFSPFKFDITNVVREKDNVLVVRVESYDEENINRKKQVGGIFYHWDCRDPTFNPGGIWRSVEIHRTGPVWFERIKVIPKIAGNRAELRILIWMGSEIEGVVRIRLEIEPKNFEGQSITHELDIKIGRGHNKHEAVVVIENPKLWWTWDHGDPNLYRLKAKIIAGEEAYDEREITFGIKEVRLVQKHGRWVFYLNGRRIFLRGTNYGPTDQRIANVTREDIERDAKLMREANINAVRIHAHVNPLAWEVFDEYGILVWQDMPLQWSYDKSVEKEAIENARELVRLAENHASVGILCAHNEPFLYPDPPLLARSALAFIVGLLFSAFFGSLGMRYGISLVSNMFWKEILGLLDKPLFGLIKLGWLLGIVLILISMFPGFALMLGGLEAILFSVVVGIVLPWDAILIWVALSFLLGSPITALTYNWNKTVLDRKLVRVLREEDMCVHPVVKYSGGAGWFIDGTDTHIYDGWYTGWLTPFIWLRGYRHIKTFIGPFRGVFRCVSEFGAQAFPKKENLLKFLPRNLADKVQRNFKNAYPEMAKYLKKLHQYQPEFMRLWVNYKECSTLDEFIDRTQDRQAELIKFYVEYLRARKYRPTGGIFQFMFTDIAPLIIWSVVDYWREPKKAYYTLKETYRPVIAVLEWPNKGKAGRGYKTKIYLINDFDTNFDGEVRIKVDHEIVFRKEVSLLPDSVETIPAIFRLSEKRGAVELIVELDLASYGVVTNKYRLVIN